MFAAGTDTTSTAMEWAMAEVITHPDSMRKLQDELRAAVGGSGHVITEDHIDKLHYLKAVVKETLRLHPPIPLLVPREPQDDAEILGHHVPAGTRVVINAWAIGRDPKYWEAPEEFRPERFEDSTVDFTGSSYEFLPFGAGRRICPAINFALPVLEIAVASLVRHFDWEIPAEARLDMNEAPGLITPPLAPLRLVPKCRRQQ